MAVELGQHTELSHPNRDTEMETPVGNRPIWDEIELSESYLVCSMFEEAASMASCVLKRLREKKYMDEVAEDAELDDMFESAGMVFVQSLKELGRTMEIITELTQLYGSLTDVPVQVFLAGACFYMQEDPHGVKNILDEYLSKWRFIDEQYYILANVNTNTSSKKIYENRFVLEVDKYVQIVEAYITLLTTILSDTDLAISWVEKAELPEHIRQEYLRRIQSMHSSKITGTQPSTSAFSTDGNVTSSVSLEKEVADDAAKQAILRYSGQRVSTVWWFRKINLKFGSVRFAISNGSVFLMALMLLTYYFMRRKKYTITSILKGQAMFLKKIAIDLWQLAFSYQVNPLATIEPLQNPTRVSR